MVLAGNIHKNTTQFTSSGASYHLLCRQCPLIAKVQVCKCSSRDKHSILGNCFFLTRCGLAVVNVPLIFSSCFHSPILFLPCFHFSSTPTLGLSLFLACLLGCSPAGHQALLHSSPTPCRGQEPELSCLSWIFHQDNGRSCCRRQP